MKLHQFFFWLLVFFLPTQLGRHFWPDFSLIFGLRVDYLSPTIYLTDLLVVGILGSWGIENIKNLKSQISKLKIKTKNLKLFFVVSSVLLFLLVNSLLAKNPGAALYKFLKIIEFTLLGLYIVKNHYSLPTTHYSLSLAVIYSSLIVIFQFFKQASLGGIFYWLGERTFNIQTPGIALGEVWGRLFLRPYGTFSHPNSMAGFLLVSLILILAFSGKRLASSKIDWVAVGLGTVAILLSFSRAVWLIGLLVGLWWVVRRKLSMLFVVCSLLFLILLGTNFPRLGEKPVQERVQLVQASFEMIKSNPISGVGLNNFIVRLPEFWQTSQVRLLQPVHNIYLLIASETGLVGLVIFLWLLILTYKKLLITNYYLLITALSAILALGLFDHYWFTLQQNQLLSVIILGLAWGAKKD